MSESNSEQNIENVEGDVNVEAPAVEAEESAPEESEGDSEE